MIAGITAALLIGAIALIVAFWKGDRDEGGGGTGGGSGGGGTVASKRVLFVVPPQGLYYPDYGPVKDRLTQRGIDVDTASTRLDDCVLEGAPAGARVKPNRVVTDIKNLNEYSAILFCGRNTNEYDGAPSFAGYRAVESLIADARRNQKTIGGICIGQRVAHPLRRASRPQSGCLPARGQ